MQIQHATSNKRGRPNNMVTNREAGFLPPTWKSEGGFSLIEITIALVILMVVVMGVFAAFTYATVYNTGNNWRSQALSVLQDEVETLRAVKFNPPPAVVAPELA